MLAERWKVADGGRTWTFHLRKGVQFHDGRGELTAEDVRFTFATLARDGSANSLAPEFRLIKSMEVENPYTLTVRFEKPFVAFGNKVNQGLFASVAFIQSKRHMESGEEDGAERHPGRRPDPWKFVEHVRGDRIVYEAVENHWRATPHFKRLVFLKVPEPATRMAMLRAGSVDVIEIGGEYVGRAEEGRRADARSCRTCPGSTSSSGAVADEGDRTTRRCPGRSPTPSGRARCAWRSIWRSTSKRSCSASSVASDRRSERWLMYPADPWASDALKKPYPYDPAKAKALLAEAGYPGGFDVTMNLTPWPGRGFLPDVGEAVATYWEKIGIRVKRRPVDRAVFASDFRARAYSGVALAYASPLVAPGAVGGSHTERGYTKAAPEPVRRASEARRVHRSARRAAELPGARAHHAGRDGPLAHRVRAGRRHRRGAFHRWASGRRSGIGR